MKPFAMVINAIFVTTAFQASAQAPKTVLDGVYTEQQAARGAGAYAESCARCHGENLQGRNNPALKGNGFVERWREDPLDVVFTHMSTRMPPGNPGTPAAGLPRATYVDLLAFLLQQNEYPAGATELTEDAVQQVMFYSKDGPKPLTTNALVGAVGCLTPATGDNWELKNATEPFRVRVADEVEPDELKRAGARTGAAVTIRLQNVSSYKPESLTAKRVQAKGSLVRRPNDIRINVLSLEPVGECTQ